MKSILSISVGLFLAAVLALGGCAVPQSGQEASAASSAQPAPADFSVELEPMTGEELLADLASDPNYSKYALDVASVTLEIDESRREVLLTVELNTSELEQMEAAGMAVAQCLSDHSKVIEPDGSIASDNGPGGMLYEAYSLSLRCVPTGVSSELAIDGWLPAGAGEMMWQ